MHLFLRKNYRFCGYFFCFLGQALGWSESEEHCQCQEIIVVSTSWDSGQGCAVAPSFPVLWSGGKEKLWGCISTAMGVTKLKNSEPPDSEFT